MITGGVGAALRAAVDKSNSRDHNIILGDMGVHLVDVRGTLKLARYSRRTCTITCRDQNLSTHMGTCTCTALEHTHGDMHMYST
jgi:hypothetical protein